MKISDLETVRTKLNELDLLNQKRDALADASALHLTIHGNHEQHHMHYKLSNIWGAEHEFREVITKFLDWQIQAIKDELADLNVEIEENV